MIDCDASNVAQGRVLSQIQKGEVKVICYFSRCFSKAERYYCATRREFLYARLKNGRIMLYPPASVRLSVRPSVNFFVSV